MIDAELYTISVRKEVLEGEALYVARIAEFPDVEEYGDSYEEARQLAIDTINTSYELCLQEGIHFPEPMSFKDIESVSGRVTLRMPKSLHAMLAQQAVKEDVSLNQFLVSSLSLTYGQCQMSELFMDELKSRFTNIKTEFSKTVASTFLFREQLSSFSGSSSKATRWEQKREYPCAN